MLPQRPQRPIAVEEVVAVAVEEVVTVAAVVVVVPAAVCPNSVLVAAEVVALEVEDFVLRVGRYPRKAIALMMVVGRLGRRARRRLHNLLGLVCRIRLLVCRNGLRCRLGCLVGRIGGSLLLLGKRDSSICSCQFRYGLALELEVGGGGCVLRRIRYIPGVLLASRSLAPCSYIHTVIVSWVIAIGDRVESYCGTFTRRDVQVFGALALLQCHRYIKTLR